MSKVAVDPIAAPFREEIKLQIQEQFAAQPPLLVGFLANNDPAARKYAEWTQRSCQQDGIAVEIREVDPIDLETKVTEANADPAVHGILIFYPIFGNQPSFYGQSMDAYLRDIISPDKDVEGLCHLYRYNLYHNIRQFVVPAACPAAKGTLYIPVAGSPALSSSITLANATPAADAAATAPSSTSTSSYDNALSANSEDKIVQSILPCTPLAVVKILEALNVYDASLPVGDRLAGKTITIFNRSEIVGRPLGAMLANDKADVYSVDIDSLYLFQRGKLNLTEETKESACKKSHVIVLGVPVKDFKLPIEWISPNTIIVNVSSFKNVDEAAVLTIPGVQYVPLVGKVTVAMLERNLLRLYRMYHASSSK